MFTWRQLMAPMLRWITPNIAAQAVQQDARAQQKAAAQARRNREAAHRPPVGNSPRIGSSPRAGQAAGRTPRPGKG